MNFNKLVKKNKKRDLKSLLWFSVLMGFTLLILAIIYFKLKVASFLIDMFYLQPKIINAGMLVLLSVVFFVVAYFAWRQLKSYK